MKIQELFEQDETILLEMPEEDLIKAEQILKHKLMRDMGLNFIFRNHVKDRAVAQGSREQYVTKEEVVDTLSKLVDTKKGKIMGDKQKGKEYEAVVTNKENDLNIIFAIDFGNRGNRHLFKVLTMMKKKNFKAYGDAHFYV